MYGIRVRISFIRILRFVRIYNEETKEGAL